ncbi:trmB [Symbiodinium natans]|uniref:tRNA (guanine(46)-N(7))-methyltransferase n=1 Tax=Symbiodinium natans TaxID=878477 RepID=A0A812T7Z5_9DINO|nr:trmB [Symbiodinium natans]
MPQKWRSRPRHGKGPAGGPAKRTQEKSSRAQDLTKTIAELARNKQLKRAIATFHKFEEEGLQPSVYTFSSLINAYVRAADVPGALEVMSAMKRHGIKPNVSIFTILLKGYSQEGKMNAARALLDEMIAQGVAPDARAVNAFFRGCLYHGDVPLASDVFSKMESSWQLVPDSISLRYVVQLLSQGLRVSAIKELMKKLQKANPLTEHGGGKTMGRQACKFWASGTCTKGVNCKFHHDLEASPESQERMQQEKVAAMAAMNLSMAHAAAMLGRWPLCRRALKCAEDFYESTEEGGQGGVGSHGLFQELSREEASREIQRISHFLNQEQPPEPYSFLCRTFLFGTEPCTEKAELAQCCVDELVRSFGLGEVLLRVGLSEEDARTSFRLCLSKKLRLRGSQIFAPELHGKRKIESDPPLPMKMEICSGNGDWVIAQAKADEGLANWMALELRHDRVHQIFSRMVFRKACNLCLLRGDAGRVVPAHVQPESMSHVFINFPEPPHFSGDETAESKSELLTGSFFSQLHTILQQDGKLTILSDNWRYVRRLVRTLAELRDENEQMFLSAGPRNAKNAELCETLYGIDLFCGMPDKHVGHKKKTTSYFDRLWTKGQHLDRYYFMVQKA